MLLGVSSLAGSSPVHQHTTTTKIQLHHKYAKRFHVFKHLVFLFECFYDPQDSYKSNRYAIFSTGTVKLPASWYGLSKLGLTASLQKHFNQISKLDQCDRGDSSLRSLFISYISQSLFQTEDLPGYISSISPTTHNHNHATKELSRDRCVRSKKQQTSPEMLFYRFSERKYEEGSISTTL